MDGDVLFRTDGQLSVPSQALFGAEHTLKLREKYMESMFSVTISAICTHHMHTQTHTRTHDAVPQSLRDAF